MNYRRTLLAAALGFAAMSTVAALPAWSGDDADDSTAREARHARRADRIEARLERLAERLKIQPEQEAAWAAYAQTVRSVFGEPRPRPPADADAATLLRFRAERAAEHAQKLNRLADATQTLQQALTPEQRETLNEALRHGMGRHGRHGHFRGHKRG
ncbi:MAG TPA: Spy/CpxP family protein refolding chaperone [Burkholderiales bacterium]